jgi:hypothetical protein
VTAVAVAYTVDGAADAPVVGLSLGGKSGTRLAARRLSADAVPGGRPAARLIGALST